MASILTPLLLLSLVAAGCGRSNHEHEAHAATASATEPKPHGNHDPMHGGLVLMDGHDHHVELVLDVAGKNHRVYVSDGVRAPLMASTFDELKLSITVGTGAAQVVRMQRAIDDSHWMGTSEPVPATGAKVGIAYSKGGARLYEADLAVEYVLTGKMPAPSVAAPEPAHGGHLVETPDGYLELVAKPDGTFQVWLLGRDHAPRSIEGASGQIALSKKGYSDVVLAPVGDHLAGRGAAVSGHPTARVSVELGGAVIKASVPLHLEGSGGGHSH